MEYHSAKTWIEISKSALEKNMRIFKTLIKPQTKLMAVVKSNAYGHGMVESAQCFVRSGADWLGVFDFNEAQTLRYAGLDCPILVFGPTHCENFQAAVAKNISLTVSAHEQVEELIPGLKIHIKVETGLARQGFFPSDLKEVINRINGDVSVEGIYTHLADSHHVHENEYSQQQLNIFNEAVEILEFGKNKNVSRAIKHVVATDGLLTLPEGELDMVRIGIGLYGLPPSKEWEQKFRDLGLIPALTWKTRISEIKEIAKNSPVGYGRTEIVERKTKIAVLPVGYWDGYPRSLSSHGLVGIDGRISKVLGRVCMNMIMTDVSDISSVRAGDECVLLGGNGETSAVSIAESAGTISYEIVTRINPTLPRFFK